MVNNDRNSPMLGRTELGLIRLVIASYFLAMSFGMVTGVNPSIAFSEFYPEATAQVIGSAVMAGCSLFIFFGFGVRLACVTLSLLVLTSTVMVNVSLEGITNPEPLWRDVMFVAVLMLIYGNQTRHSLSKLAFFRRRKAVRKISVPLGASVSPRRVSAQNPVRQVPVAVAQNPDVIDLPAFIAKSKRKGSYTPKTGSTEPGAQGDIENVIDDLDQIVGSSKTRF